MDYTLFCVLPDGKPTFPVEIPNTRTVGQLKDAIKFKIPLSLNAIEARDLTLYKIDLDGSDMKYIEEVKNMVRKLGDLHPLNQLDLLDMVFPEAPNPRDPKIHILVVPPPGEPGLWLTCCR